MPLEITLESVLRISLKPLSADYYKFNIAGRENDLNTFKG